MGRSVEMREKVAMDEQTEVVGRERRDFGALAAARCSRTAEGGDSEGSVTDARSTGCN